MNKKTVLVTGILGFLGKNLIQHLLERGYQVVGVAQSENSISKFERKNNLNIPIYMLDISNNYYNLKRIIEKHSVDYIIHAAAMKHVGLCEKNPTRAYEVNVEGSRNILRAAKEAGIKNAIGVSTDKAINPTSVYGATKNMMEKMFLENEYGIFQGVNFLYSSESVLEIWEEQRQESTPLLVHPDSTRYFIMIDSVSKKIIDCLDYRETFFLDKCFKIKITDLQEAFSEIYNYWEVEDYRGWGVEKIVEEISPEIEIISPTKEEIKQLLKIHLKKREKK